MCAERVNVSVVVNDSKDNDVKKVFPRPRPRPQVPRPGDRDIQDGSRYCPWTEANTRRNNTWV